jgi:hypothetical protein
MTTKSLLLTELGGSVSADVDAPADEAFALLTETGRLPEWNTRIRRVLEPAPAPLAPGVEWVVQMQVTPIPGQRSRIEVSWLVSPRTFWRRALFGKLRRRQMGDEVPASLRALAALLAPP